LPAFMSLRGARATKQSRAFHLKARTLRDTYIHMNKAGYVYILTNERNTVLYTGVTSDLVKRVHEHKGKMIDGFTRKYNLNKLVYYEIYSDIKNAIEREKQIKAGSRKGKVELIESFNPGWEDLSWKISG